MHGNDLIASARICRLRGTVSCLNKLGSRLRPTQWGQRSLDDSPGFAFVPRSSPHYTASGVLRLGAAASHGHPRGFAQAPTGLAEVVVNNSASSPKRFGEQLAWLSRSRRCGGGPLCCCPRTGLLAQRGFVLERHGSGSCATRPGRRVVSCRSSACKHHKLPECGAGLLTARLRWMGWNGFGQPKNTLKKKRRIYRPHCGQHGDPNLLTMRG